MKELLEKLLKDDRFTKMLDEISKGEATINVEKTKTGGFKIESEGSRLSTLLLLAATQNEILKKLNCDDEEYKCLLDLVKSTRGFMKNE